MLSWTNHGIAGLLLLAGAGGRPVLAEQAQTEAFAPTQADFEAELADAGSGMAEKLREYAEWCRSVKLFLDQEVALENLLQFVPDDRETHLLLRHRLQKDGSWFVPEKRKPKKNVDERKFEESAERRTAITRDFTTRVFAAAEHFAEALTPERLHAVHELILRLDPNHAEVRALRGEFLSDDVWVLEESLRAKQRRGEIKNIVKLAFSEIGPSKPAVLDRREELTGIKWKATARVEHVRVLSTGSKKECERIARATEATILCFRRIMDDGDRPFPVMTVYVLDSADDRDQFIRKWTTWGEGRLNDLRKMAGSGMINSLNVARWDESEAHRLDGAVRHTIGILMARDFGITVEVPWAWEGIGLYLARELIGTRLTWYGRGVASPAAAHQVFIKQVMDNEVNWVNEGYLRLQSEQGPRLESVLSKRIAELDIYDFLVAYVFGAYLMEGRPEELSKLLRRIGRDRKTQEQAFREVLETDVGSLETRLIRWLGERR